VIAVWSVSIADDFARAQYADLRFILTQEPHGRGRPRLHALPALVS